MSADSVPVPARDIETLKANGRPLFDLGNVVATPAVLALLDKHGVRPATLLSFHQYGEWGNLGAEDAQALIYGTRVLSIHVVGGEDVWVITEAETGQPNRQRSGTTMLFPREY